mgnify:CR=1 FL=1
MYLKSLEIQGFKSFPDRTLLQFGSDCTAIVGPNGSGKSNISDAISWVLGEQSTKALRGAKMEDVIFGGTAKRPAVGYAEATLTLDNTDGTLRMETPEVMITRRYFRSGESEYYINKQLARLRDINELFMDTGLGREGYSNIGQGRVDEILALKSTDRREVFEEAAGISKYRHRKEETERRLASTEDNLLRIGDKISELELQVEPLREQAEKAQKYLTLRDELKGLEVTVWLDSLTKLAENARKAETDYASAAFILEQAHDELTQLYSKSEQLSLQYNQQTLQLDARREQISAMEAARQQAQNDITLLQAEAEHHRTNISRIEQELRDQKSRSGGIAGQIAAEQQKIAQAQQTLTEIDSELQQALLESGQLTASSEDAGQQLVSLRAQQALLQTQRASAQAQIDSMHASLEEVLARRQMLTEDRQAALARQTEITARQAECKKHLEQAQDEVQSAKNTIAGYALRLKTRQEKRDALQKQVNAAGVQLDTIDAKIRMLQELEREFEGFSKAVRLVMQEAGSGALRGVHGPVSKLIRVEDQYTTAIETALGAAMQNIVVSTEEDGKAAIQMLKRRDGGRATFLPLTTIRPQSLQDTSCQRQPGFVGIASGLVQCADPYRAVIENALGRTVICDTLDNAVRMARASGNRVRIVTLDGQVMNAGGSMTGGSTAKSAGVLTRANTLEKLAGQRQTLAAQLETIRQQAAEAASAAARTEFEITAVQGTLRGAEDEVLRRTEEHKQAQLLAAAISENLENIDRELARITSHSGGEEGRLRALEQQLQSAQESAGALEKQEQAICAQQNALSGKLQTLNESVTQLRMQAASVDAARAASQSTIAQLQALSEAMQGDVTQKTKLIADYQAQIAALQQQIQEKTDGLQTADTALEQARQELREAVDTRAQLEARRNQTEKQAQEKNQSIVQLERETARLEQKKATSELEEKQIVDKLWDSYELTPGTAEAEKVEIESLAAANKRIAEVRRKISALGTPNLGAIEEYARVSERYEYLASQRDDVQHAKKELEAIIGSITTEMTEIFVREFARINEYFGHTFTEMFGGGKAALILEDPSAPLTCGIEIRVQPPGKQVKTITLLSGGEKAFVAIALYFAILKVRPTPFCMLDEIDAALDDRNVERFAQYLHTLSANTQFIVITHRRGTMEAADVLYGVTMQEQGVSKILRLSLDEMAKQMGITA